MNKLVLILFILFTSTIYSQSVEYSYDEAGNRIKRNLVVLNPGGGSSRMAQQVVEEQLTPDLKLTVYPNPVKELLNLKVDGDFQSYDISLTDLSGKVFLTKTIKESNTQLNFSDYPKGIYILRTGLNNQFIEWKIVRQ